MRAVGMLDNFPVERGRDTKVWTAKPRMRLLSAAESLLKRVRKDRDYINYDYQYAFSTDREVKHSLAFSLVLPGGAGATVYVCRGQIIMEVARQGNGEVHIAETLDLRRTGPIQTAEKGLLKVYKRFNPIRWEQKLPTLIDFLLKCSCERVRIRHH